MKTFTRFLLAFACLFFILSPVYAQETLKIGGIDESNNTGSTPFTPFYSYSASQVIYTKEELTEMDGKQITALAYGLPGIPGSEKVSSVFVEVYMGYIETAAFSTPVTSFIPLDGMTKVFSGMYDISQKDLNTIQLQTPFSYDGTRNLLISVAAPQKIMAPQNRQFYATGITGGIVQAIHYKNDKNAFGTFPTENPSTEAKRPNTTFTYRDNPTTPLVSLASSSIDFGYKEINGSFTKSIQISNIGIEILSIAEMEGLAAPFTSNSASISLADGLSANLEISFNPTAEGYISQNVNVKTNGGDAALQLFSDVYPLGGLVEDFDEATIPNLWRTRANKWAISTTGGYSGTHCIKVGNTQDTLVTPKVQNGKLIFYAKQESTTKELQILYSENLQTWTVFKSLSDFTISTSYAKQEVDLSALPENVFLAIVGKNISLDYILLTKPVRPIHDVYLIAFTPPSSYNEKTDVYIPVKVKNWGSGTEASFKIELRNAETNALLSDTTIAESFASMTEVEHSIRWSPLPNVSKIYAQVVLTDDSDPTNDQSIIKSTTVVPYVAVMSIAKKILNFDILFADRQADTLSLELKNTGIAPLNVMEVKGKVPFGIDESVFTIDPKSSRTVKIFLAQHTPAYYADSLVFVFEGKGDSVVKVSGTIQRLGDLFESFENGVFPPFMWRQTEINPISSGNWVAHNSSSIAYKGNYSARQQNAKKADTLITPKLRVVEGEQFSFYARHWSGVSENTIITVSYSENLKDWTELRKLIKADATLPGIMTSYSIELPQGEYYIGFSGLSEAMLDYVQGPQIIYPDKDLKFISSSIPSKGNVNNELMANVKVQNMGNLKAEEYKIQLMQGETVLAEKAGEPLERLEIKEMEIAYIPIVATTMNGLYFRIVLEDDEDISNNDGVKSNLMVYEEFFGEFLVGDASSTDPKYPVSTNYKYSINEMLYYSSELGFKKGSKIKELTYYYGGSQDLTFPIRIWVGETDLVSLKNEWINPSDLTYMSLDTAKFKSESGKKMISFAFDSLYTYKGGNLVVLMEREWTSDYKSIPFYTSTDATNKERSRMYHVDGNAAPAYNHADPIPFSSSNVSGIYPAVLFSVDKPTVLISGHVKNDEGHMMENAEVNLKSGPISYTVNTDENGFFEIKTSATNRDYILSVFAGEYLFSPRSIHIKDVDIDMGDLVVAGKTYSYTVSLSSENGESLYGTRVELKVNASIESFVGMINSQEATADVVFEDLAKGDYALYISNKNFKDFKDTEIMLTDTLARDIELKSRDSIVIKGRVIASFDQSALEGASISFSCDPYEYRLTTDAEGYFSLKTNKVGRNYTVKVEKFPSYESLNTNLDLPITEKDTILNTYALELINIVLTFNVSTSDGQSANGAFLKLCLNGTTDTLRKTVNNGKVIYDNLLPGLYGVELSKEAYNLYTDTLSVIQVQSKDILLQKTVIVKHPSLRLKVSASTGESMEGQIVYLENNYTGSIYEKSVNAEGFVYFDNLTVSGIHTLEIFKIGYRKYIDASLLINDSIYKEVVLQEIIVDPYALEADIRYDENTAAASVEFKWNDIGEYFMDSYEDYEEFSLTFAPWKTIDLDGLGVVSLAGRSYPNLGAPQAATIFNPFVIEPMLTDAFAMPYSGKKMMAFFGVANGVNDDWAISPKRMIRQGDVVAFMTKQLTAAPEKEKLSVWISTTDNEIESFHKISDGNYLSVGPEWGLFVGDLAEYIGQEIYVGLHCTSSTGMMLVMDDFYIGNPVGEQLQKAAVGKLSQLKENEMILASAGNATAYKVYVDGELLNTIEKNNISIPDLSPGNHTLGVKAVYQSGESELSTLDITIEDLKAIGAKFVLNLTTNANEVADGAILSLYDTARKETHTYTIANEKVEFNYLRKAIYNLSITKDGFETIEEEFKLFKEEVLDRKLIEIIKAPVNPYVTVSREGSALANATFSWDKEVGFKEGFESYKDFTQALSPWANLDKDGFKTFGLSNCSFPGAQGAMAALVFNPSNTTPPVTGDASSLSHSGKKHVVFIASDQGQCNDWLISPVQEIRDSFELRFFAKSYNDVYGLEKMEVLISETDDKESSFKKIASLLLPTKWAEYKYDLSAYKGKNIYVAFNYISSNTFYMSLDDIYIGSKDEAPSPSSSRVLNYKIFLNGELKATQKEREYVFASLSEGDYEAAVQAEYASGISAKTLYNFKVEKVSLELTSELKTLVVYPNPVKQASVLTIVSPAPMQELRIISLDGRMVYRTESVKGVLQAEIPADFNPGVYIIEVLSANAGLKAKFVIR